MSETRKNRLYIPLDASGAMRNIMDWPWFWRYPVSLVGVATCLWFTFANADGAAGVRWGVVGLGGLGSLVCAFPMFELLLLGVFIGFVYGFVKLVSLFLPESSGTGWLPSMLVGAGFYAVYSLYLLTDEMGKLKQSNESLHAKVDQLLSSAHLQEERWSQQSSEAWDAAHEETGDEWNT